MLVSIEWLSKRRALLQEIEYLETELASMGQAEAIRYDRVQVQSAPDSTLDNVVIRRGDLRRKIDLKRNQALKEYEKIEFYLERVKDPQVRTIMRMRFVKCMTWEEIGEALHMHRSTVVRIVERYIARSR